HGHHTAVRPPPSAGGRTVSRAIAGERRRPSPGHPVPGLPALPEPVSPVRRQLARCQVPAPVLPELMTSVPVVPTRTFTRAPGGFHPPGAGVRPTGPLAAAAPAAI